MLTRYSSVQFTKEKIDVWCAVFGNRILGQIVFDRTTNAQVYLIIFEEFYEQSTVEEKEYNSQYR